MKMFMFCLRRRFWGAQQINQFIVNGVGTAEEAIKALDYGIYKTEQMVGFVQWMHDYNQTVDEQEKIYFYGNDMQRYDYSKKGCLIIMPRYMLTMHKIHDSTRACFQQNDERIIE